MYVCMCTPTSSQPDTSRAAATLLSSTSESRAADNPVSTTSRATGTPLSTNSREEAKTTLSTIKSSSNPIVYSFKSSSKPIVNNQESESSSDLDSCFPPCSTVSTSHGTHLGSTERPKRRHFEGSLHQNFRDWSQQNIFFLNNYIDFTKCLSLNF